MILLLKKIKQTLIKVIYVIFYHINFKKNLENYILFESNPDFTDSPKNVFDKMIEEKINDKYKLIWFVKDDEKFNNINIKNVLFIKRDKKLRNRIRVFNYIFKAKYIIDSNSCIKKINKRQKRIFLTHGCPIKKVSSYCENIGKIDFLTVPSKWSINITRDLYKINESKIAVTGLPRNDCFFVQDSNEEKIIKNNFKNEKYIVWLPTYRNHKNIKMDFRFNVKTDFSFGVPIIDDNSIELLNDFLKEQDIKLYIKLHPVENTDSIKKLQLSNISLINDDDLSSMGLSLNQFLKYSIGLLTDYSSAYYDYCNTLKPIGLTIPDFDEYTKHVQLVFDYKKEIIGEYIYNYNDLQDYIIKSKNSSMLSIQYKEYEKYNDFQDALSSERVIKLLNIDMGENNDKKI